MNWTVLWSKLKALEGKVDSLEIISFEKVEELPEEGERNVIYLVPKEVPGVGDYSDEYIWDSENETFEKIGDTQIAPIEDYIKNSSIAPLYDSTSTYAVGDIVAYEKELYRCTTAISTAEAWDSTHWTKTDIISEMPVIPPIPADANHNVASAYDSTATYAVGDLCIYNGNLYECITAISTAEEWTAAHWTQKTVAQELAGVKCKTIVYQARSYADYIELLNGKTFEDVYNDIQNGLFTVIAFGNSDGSSIYNYLFPIDNFNMGYTAMNFYTFVYQNSGYEYIDCYRVRSTTYSNQLTRKWRVNLATIPPRPNGSGDSYKILLSGSYSYNLSNYKLPASLSSADEGKVLTVNASGNIEALASSGGLPAVTSADEGKMAIVDSNGEWAAMLGPFQQTVTGTLEAGETSIILSHANITTDSVLDIYTDTYGVNPTAVTVAAGSVTLTFEAQANDLGVKVRFFTDVPTPVPNGNLNNVLNMSIGVQEVTE